ncbi:thiamine phosphate synthase [Methylobacterium planeticum]|uniref:Thiamine phosphate synthase n=1 Tax=Methylobacterium planeticum TaxID=2615211 RepID=A0A6N6MLW2_9HYPH|nr:thiamine phosphate synthase [Methylobacterium planeticum]KAB1071076.1 thiamine phosphate synthase [Methylobacterium planeticum]
MSLPSPLLAVTDRRACADLAATVRGILAGGGRWIWFREPDLAAAERHHLAEALLAQVRRAGGRLSVGRDVALAAAIGADGVHLPGGSGPEAIAGARRALPGRALIGVSAHGPGEIARAAGADYVTLSPIFETASKPGYGPALGPAALDAAARSGIPVLALGGITPGALPACRHAGAAGFAVMGGLMRACDPARATAALLAAWDPGQAPDPEDARYFGAGP